MALLFKFDKEGKLADEAAYQVTAFRELIAVYDEQIFRYVALVVDYESPYQQKPLVEKKRLAAIECLGKGALPPVDKEEPNAPKLIEEAMRVYDDIQYDHIEAQLQTMRNAHYEYTVIINDSKVMNDKGEIDDAAVRALQTVQKLMNGAELDIDRLAKKVLERRNEDSRSRGDKRDSWLSKHLTSNHGQPKLTN